MDWLTWLVMLLVSLHAARTTQAVVRATTGFNSPLVWWISVFAAYGVIEGVAKANAGNPLALTGMALAVEVSLHVTEAIVRFFSPQPLKEEAVNEEVADEAEEIEEEEYDEDYDYETDEDYEQAVATAERLADQIEGSDWEDARRLANELVDETLPELLELRDELMGDLEELDEKIEDIPEGPWAEKRRASLEESRGRTQALYERVDDAVQEAKGTLERLLVLARERRVGTAPDATGEATRLLTETQQTNQLLLAARRETELVGR